MNAALLLLIGLQLRGLVRFFLRGLLSLKGSLLAILGATFFLLWIVSLAFTNTTQGGIEPGTILRSGPGLLLLYCLMNVMLSSGERGIYFTPSEINFLFPAPMSRRSLLGYKVLSSLIVGLPTSLVLSAVSYGFSTSFLTAFVGMMLIVLFMQLFTMTINLIAVTLGAALFSRTRKALAVAALLLACLVIIETRGNPFTSKFADWLQAAVQTRVWEVVTLPLTWFFDTFAAKNLWPDLVRSASLGLLVDAVLLGIVFALDAQYMETAAFASARTYARIKRIRTGAGGAAPPSRFRFALPMPPSLGGIGPLSWRQLTTSTRMPSRLLFLVVIFLFDMVVARATNRPSGSPFMLAIVTGFTILITAVFLTALLPFDFRGDVDRIALLKTLPIVPWRLALGQILVPALLVSLVQWLVLAATFLWIMHEGISSRLTGPRHPGAALLFFAAFAPPLNVLLFALENLLFLLFPSRILAHNPADFQALGRNVLFLLAKTLALAAVVFLALMVGYVVGFFFPLLGLVLAWLTIVFFTAPLIPLIGWAFNLFDVGRDTPA